MRDTPTLMALTPLLAQLAPHGDPELRERVRGAVERIAAEYRIRRGLLATAPRRSEARAQLERLAWFLEGAAEALEGLDTWTLALADQHSTVYTPAPESEIMTALSRAEAVTRPAAERRAAEWRDMAGELRSRAAQVPADQGGRRTVFHDHLSPPTRALCMGVVELLAATRPEWLAPLSCEALAFAESVLALAQGVRDADTDLRVDLYRALREYRSQESVSQPPEKQTGCDMTTAPA